MVHVWKTGTMQQSQPRPRKRPKAPKMRSLAKGQRQLILSPERRESSSATSGGEYLVCNK